MKLSVFLPFMHNFLYCCNSVIKTAKHEIKYGFWNKNVTCLICSKHLTFDALYNITMLIPKLLLYPTELGSTVLLTLSWSPSCSWVPNPLMIKHMLSKAVNGQSFSILYNSNLRKLSHQVTPINSNLKSIITVNKVTEKLVCMCVCVEYFWASSRAQIYRCLFKCIATKIRDSL